MKAGVLILMLCTSFCFADSSNFQSEVTIYSGVSFLEVDSDAPVPCIYCEVLFGPIDYTLTQSVDSTFLFGAKVGRYIHKNIEVEGNFSIGPSRDVTITNNYFCPPGDVCPLPADELYYPIFFEEQNAVTYYYDGNFVYNFHAGSITPFFSIGLGGVSTNVHPETVHDFALLFGGGAKFYFDHVGLRFELVDRVLTNYFLTDDTEHDLQVQYGVLFGF